MLQDKQMRFCQAIARFILDLGAAGYGVTFGEAYRTPEQARRYAQQGKGISDSLHTDRLAIDLLLFRDGAYLKETEDYRQAGDIWESYTGEDEHCWGGRFGDGNHFSFMHNGKR